MARETALITGASSGIGEQFARQLAARDYDVVLVARRRDRLEKLALELPTQAQVVDCDLSCDWSKLTQLDREIDLLVNNAGFGSWGRFVDLDVDREAEQIRLNCEAVVRLTHAFLPGMIERGRGGVITVASTAGHQPLPYEATYAATKAFARSFTLALSAELKGTGVRTLCIDPGPVATEWQAVAGYEDPEDNTMGVPGKIGPEQVVSEALRAWERGKRELVPGRLMRWVMRATKPVPTAMKLQTVERQYRPK